MTIKALGSPACALWTLDLILRQWGPGPRAGSGPTELPLRKASLLQKPSGGWGRKGAWLAASAVGQGRGQGRWGLWLEVASDWGGSKAPQMLVPASGAGEGAPSRAMAEIWRDAWPCGLPMNKGASPLQPTVRCVWLPVDTTSSQSPVLISAAATVTTNTAAPTS